MELSEKESSEFYRTQIAKSLDDKRQEVDRSRDQKSTRVENESDEATRLNRIAADKKTRYERAKADIDNIKNRVGLDFAQISDLADKNVNEQRANFDKVQVLAREEEDRIRDKERLQKRLIAEGLLGNERDDTDNSLFFERERMDLLSTEHAALLSEEKHSHNLTKDILVTRDQFLAIVSHDLKNPLGAISLSTALMRRNLSKISGDEVTKSLKNLAIIERSAANMDRMISDLLDLERISSGKLELKIQSCDICSVLRECKELFSPVVASKAFSMTVESNFDQIFVNLDYDRILQVLSNLIGNALKFTPTGGSIKLAAHRHSSDVEISVSDDGPGIPDQKRAQIFEKFSQLKSNDRSGLGLGLFISKWIVEAHMGSIRVTTSVGKGCIFKVVLPITPSS